MKNITFGLNRYISICAAMALGLAAMAPNARAGDEANHGPLTAKDYKFVREAARGGAMEVDLGNIAVQQASNRSVRDFGQRMVADHQKANQELTDLLARKGVTLPDASSKKEDKMSDRLKSLSGADFDKAFIKAMVKDHKKVVKEFTKESQSGDDPDLKAWVMKTLPTLQEHLDQAQTVEENVTGIKRTSKAD